MERILKAHDARLGALRIVVSLFPRRDVSCPPLFRHLAGNLEGTLIRLSTRVREEDLRHILSVQVVRLRAGLRGKA